MGSKSSESNSTIQLPSYYTDASRQAVNLGEQIANRTYTPYEGEAVAPLSAEEQQAGNMAQDAPTGNAYSTDAANRVGDVQDDFSKANLSSYENPYTQAAIDPAIRQTNLSAQQAQLSTKHQAMAQGAEGGSRETLNVAGQQRAQLNAVGGVEAQGEQQAFQQAVNGWTNDQNNQLRTSQVLQNVGAQINAGNTQQIQDLMVAGGADRAVAQNRANFAVQQFQTAQNWSTTNLNSLLTALRAPHNETDTTKSTQPTGIVGQVLGVAGAVVGAFFGGPAGAAIGSAAGAAIGGAVS